MGAAQPIKGACEQGQRSASLPRQRGETRPQLASSDPAGSRSSETGTVSLRNPRTDKKYDSDTRCSSQASQVLSRSGACSFGLFNIRPYAASARQPLALHCLLTLGWDGLGIIWLGPHWGDRVKAAGLLGR